MEEVIIEKKKFNGLLQKMLKAGQLPKAEVRVSNPKPKKRKKKAA